VSNVSVDELVTIVRKFKARWLIVDSVQVVSISVDELRRLANLPGLRGLVAVSQATKAGEVKGQSALAHEADIVIEVKDMQWSINKSRFQAPLLNQCVWGNKIEKETDNGSSTSTPAIVLPDTSNRTSGTEKRVQD
jgi:hypothetical protein